MNEHRPRRGPPYKPESEKHSDRIELRVTAEQKECDLLAAALEGKTVSEWLRDILDGHAERIIGTHRAE